jgi:hypothetical protein
MHYGRQVGVRIPQNQSTEQVPAMTVTRVAVGVPLLVEYGDERGIKHTTLAWRFGNKVYIPPQGDGWTDAHRPFSQSINDQIIAKLDSMAVTAGPVTVPTDAVNVTGGLPDEQAEAVENNLRKS